MEQKQEDLVKYIEQLYSATREAPLSAARHEHLQKIAKLLFLHISPPKPKQESNASNPVAV